MKILITGGAGFIGSRLARSLLRRGHELKLLDNLSPQIHGPNGEFPKDLQASADCVVGDVCDERVLQAVLPGQEVIVHLAAETGTGQSMYEIQNYERVNIGGTAAILQKLVEAKGSVLQKILVASSRAIYGEGRYACQAHGVVFPGARASVDMSAGLFEPRCPVCGEFVSVLATTEDTPFSPSSFYGLTKQVQEQMVLMFAATLGIGGVGLRYQNVYGPGQSLRNPYTGILAIFSNLIRSGQSLNLFEDGLESRDFVYVDDVISATVACIEADIVKPEVFNVGSGKRTSVIEVAEAIMAHYGPNASYRVTGDFRLGDIRHNYADVTKIEKVVGYKPEWAFSDGLKAFLDWADGEQPMSADGFESSMRELRERNLLGAKS